MIDPDNFILSCIDGSTVSESVCDYSAWVAKTVSAPLRFLHTIEHGREAAVSDLSGAIGLGASEDLLNELTEVEQSRSQLQIKKGKLMLQVAKDRAKAAGVSLIKASQRHGSLAEALIDMESQIRMLVVGIRGEQHDEHQAGIGTQLETVIRSLHKPILVVNKTFTPPQKIMLAYDGSEAADKALEMVAWSPLLKKIPCHLIHVTEVDSGSDLILYKAAANLTAAGIDVTSIRLTGKIDEVLPAYQAQHAMDLTVMGAFSHNKILGFLTGSFTAKMLDKTQRPLLLLR